MSDDAETLVFEAELDAPPEKVWRSDPPSRLDLVWPTREGDTLVSFEIAAGEAGGARLTIVHRALEPTVVALHRPGRAAARAAGWRMAA